VDFVDNPMDYDSREPEWCVHGWPFMGLFLLEDLQFITLFAANRRSLRCGTDEPGLWD